ncbi:MAG: hypothetical protein ACI4ES_12060 [Roseburia sp.]
MYELDKNVFAMHMALFFEDQTEVPVLKVALKLQEEFKILFPSEPEIVPIPIDAPKEIPRCTFRNDRNASMTLALNRIDFDGGFKVGNDWKNNITIILLNFLKICKQFDIKVNRIGVIVQASGSDDVISELNSKVRIDGFGESEEKNISFVIKKQKENILLNIITNIIYNKKNSDNSKVVSIDANTDISNELPDDINGKMDIIQLIIDEIEGKLKNVF